MEKKISTLYLKDKITVLVSMFILWGVIVYVLNKVLLISPDRVFTTVVICSGIAVLAALTATSGALLVHLRKNKVLLYTEELENMCSLQ